MSVFAKKKETVGIDSFPRIVASLASLLRDDAALLRRFSGVWGELM